MDILRTFAYFVVQATTQFPIKFRIFVSSKAIKEI